MNLRHLLMLVLLSVLAISCDNVNEPTSDGKYEFSSVKLEKAVVYGEGGKVIPQSEWYNYLNEAYSEFQIQMDTAKKSFFIKDANKIQLSTSFGEIDREYRMLGDTIVLKPYEEEDYDMPWGIVINDKTIELHFTETGYGFGDDSDHDLFTDWMWITGEPEVDDIEKGEVMYFFKYVLIFKRS